MKVKQIRVAIARTVNMGNYETLRVDADATADLESNEDFKEAFDQLFKDVRKQVRKRITAEEVKKWRS